MEAESPGEDEEASRGVRAFRPARNHSFRATGITALVAADGTVDKARQSAAHASTKTTEFYNRTDDESTLDEVERIAI